MNASGPLRRRIIRASESALAVNAVKREIVGFHDMEKP
jgi:hypothetical protein